MKKILIPMGLSLVLLSQANAFNNFYEFEKFFDEMNKKMDTKYERLLDKNYQVLETNDSFVYEFEMPGLEKNDVKIYIENNNLYVNGKKEVKESNLKRRSYSYVTTLPKNINEEKVNAFMKNGILKIVIEKIAIKDNKQYIPIK